MLHSHRVPLIAWIQHPSRSLAHDANKHERGSEQAAHGLIACMMDTLDKYTALRGRRMTTATAKSPALRCVSHIFPKNCPCSSGLASERECIRMVAKLCQRLTRFDTCCLICEPPRDI